MRFKHFLLFLVLGFTAYANALSGPFMLDDFPFLAQFKSQSILSHFVPDPHQLWGIDSEKTQTTYYRPLAHIVPHLNYLFFGDQNPVGYHIVNVVLLAGAAWCVALMLSTVMPVPLAFAAGALFMVHPVNGLIINYITASVYAVQAIGICLSLTYILSPPNVSIGGPGKAQFSVLFFLMALLCHETSFMVPFYGVLLCLAQKFDLKDALRRTRWLWLVLAAYMVFRTFYVPLSNSLFHSVATSGFSWDQSIATIIRLLSWYGQKLIIPSDIFLMYSVPFTIAGSWDMISLGVVFAGLVIILFKRLWPVAPKAVLFFIWFFVGLFPVFLGSFASPQLGALLEPHWFVPATIGLFAGLVIIGDYFIRSVLWRKIIFAVLVLGLMVCGWNNNRLWSNEEGLYARWLVVDPSFKGVHYFLGLVYDREGKSEKARQQYGQSIVGRYKDWMVYLNLGKIDLIEGKRDQAKIDLGKSYALEPHYSDTLNALGAMEFGNNNFDAASKWFEKAAQANQFNMEPRMNLVVTLARMGKTAQAVAECDQILAAHPDFVPAQQALQHLRGY